MAQSDRVMLQQSVIETTTLAIGYKPRIIAENLSLVLPPGELTCLLGPNGAGKTTLMRTLAGMLPPIAGHIRIMGDDLARLSAIDLAQRLAIVLTERPQVGHMSGYELVALGRHPYTDWTGRLSAHDEAVIQWAITATGAGEIATQPIDQMSDGQRQKLLIARALAQEPAALLLDEPTAFLDLPRRVEMMRLLRELAHQANKAVLLSTHDLDLALRTADCVWLMASDGTLRIGAPEDLILNGAFEEVFRSEGVAFDVETGAFHMQPAPEREIAVMGEGLAYRWTCRALERAGYAIVGEASVRILVNDGYWQIGESAEVYSSIQKLLTELKTTRINPV